MTDRRPAATHPRGLRADPLQAVGSPIACDVDQCSRALFGRLGLED